MTNKDYMLWLSSLVSGMSSRKLNSLLEIFGTAQAVFSAAEAELCRSIRLTDKEKKTVFERRNREYIEELKSLLESRQISYISQDCDSFPTLLREIPDPPIGIFVVGNLPDDDTNKVAVIGSRTCSEYGRLTARCLSKPLAKAGVIIVSGMARGVDSVAHRAALDAGGKTIAVLGCGVDVCYPRENEGLREEIISNGCVISEYPPGTRPLPYHFPARNRIISGISRGVIVTEATNKSGTMITVDQALDQGREVFAIPGDINRELSKGTNRLIKDGAHVTLSHTDILETLHIDTKPAESGGSKNLQPNEIHVLGIIDFEPRGFDALLDQASVTNGELHLTLTALEIKGLVRRLPGSRYVKND